jgi:hypothetical protein
MHHLILINTPAHAHTYRNFIEAIQQSKNTVSVLARDYSCTLDLLEYHDIPYSCYGSHGTARYSALDFAGELPSQLARVAWSAWRANPDVVFGRGPYAAVAGTVANARVELLLDSEPSELLHKMSRWFADLILTPETTDIDLGTNHYTIDGFKECGYLHPSVFDPDPSVREDLGLDPNESFAIARFAALDALHDADADARTMSQRQELVEALSEEVTVLVSDEGEPLDLSGLDAREYDLHPARIHDALAEADLLVAETGTMVIEAAFLGTPAIACGGFVEQEFGEFVALEDAGLIEATTDLDRVASRARELLRGEHDEQFARNHERFLSGKVDLTALLRHIAADPDLGRGERALTPRRATPQS